MCSLVNIALSNNYLPAFRESDIYHKLPVPLASLTDIANHRALPLTNHSQDDLRRLAHPFKPTAEVIVKEENSISRLIFVFKCPPKDGKAKASDREGCKKGV